MAKMPSEKTQLRTAKAELAREKDNSRDLRVQRDNYRIRATKAEQECTEWKARFDTLLRNMPAAHDEARSDEVKTGGMMG